MGNYSEVPMKRPPMILFESGLNSEEVSLTFINAFWY